ncbi:FtsK/SpoIIIE domain-containing protein [Chengkuizengella marina]|uniref:FtsK domain-containing protein n=1 Tax=Chengkuizengella marina TaxID=2507566 RepID=A0A6N9PZ48_9BACL|nr:FtsK/SpoIIIE domain-containing protein [Chengkuizengella marina]NBI28082.1 hypothetical protein [Chengkuizengella marina]
MISTMVALKIMGLVASSTGILVTYRSMPSPAIRSKMMKIFKLGDLAVKHKTKNREIINYPSIVDVRVKEDVKQIIFNLPDGLNPEKVVKHIWLFKQKFGEHIELHSKSTKIFILSIYQESIKPFNYEYKDIEKKIKKAVLPIVVGQSRSGLEVYDMLEYPHLLIAGETGSGKSTQVRSVLSTLIQYCDTDKLKLYLADLKRSEFHLFRGIVNEVVYDSNALYKVLVKLKKEMKKRGDLLNQNEVAHVSDLINPPPYIILCIDEVALLKKENEIMEIIEEISAIGRALGVFLILSMQRPDSDVLDGKLKNNLTVRMAFRHSDEINSRITIGTGEAAYIKQSEKGLMYLKKDGLQKVQAPYLDLKDAKKLLQPFQNLKEVEVTVTNDIEQHQVFGVLEP